MMLLLLLLPAGASAVSDWHVFHGDARHSGFSNADAPFDSLFAWSQAADDSIFYSSPVLAEDGTIYVGDLSERLLALSPDGARLWSFEGSGNFRHSTPAVADDGTILIGGSDGVLYAVHPDGMLKWTFTVGAAIKTSPNVATDGTIYFGASDGRLYAVNADSTQAWSYPTGGEIRSSPAIGPDGTIFFGSTDGFFYALWPDGSLRWRALTGDQIKYCSPAVNELGVVYFGSYDGFVYAFGSDQQFLWAYQTDNVVRSSPAIGPDGTVYIGSDNRLLAINPNGGLEWSRSTGGTIYSSPVYFGDDDVIGIGSDDGAFYCVHADGSLDWRFTVGEPVRSTCAPTPDGRIVVADLTGIIWAFGSDNPIGVTDPGAVPAAGLTLLAAPNPSSGTVTFRLLGELPTGRAIRIFDVHGRLVTELGDLTGNRALWPGVDRRGHAVASGTYYYRVTGSRDTGRVVLIR
ncbi:MAG: PQQ-binding-like beta-propeller repeat protein [Candidatus Eiseniibacteriota bacterium]|jgi:outer membrane protein assembly factor BamB